MNAGCRNSIEVDGAAKDRGMDCDRRATGIPSAEGNQTRRPSAGPAAEGANPHCCLCHEHVWHGCRGVGGEPRPACWELAAASAGPIDPETGDVAAELEATR